MRKIEWTKKFEYGLGAYLRTDFRLSSISNKSIEQCQLHGTVEGESESHE